MTLAESAAGYRRWKSCGTGQDVRTQGIKDFLEGFLAVRSDSTLNTLQKFCLCCLEFGSQCRLPMPLPAALAVITSKVAISYKTHVIRCLVVS